MKKRYQIDREQAVRQFHKQAEESGQELQLHLPLKEVAAALQQSVGELMRQAGLELMQLIMDNEVRQLAGEHYQRRQAEQPYRWGREQGFLVVDGQKVPIQRPRLRSDDGHEQSLGSYALFRRCEPLDDAVWDKLMLGLSTRNYSQAVREFAAAYGIEKSAVSEHFVRTSREKLRELLERPLDKLKLCVIYIDGIEFKGQHLVAALGVAIDGSKTVLGLRQGASENTTVVSELLEDLAGRGVDFSAPMLYVLDGAKALTKAVRKHAGKQAPIQRCQMHKRRRLLAENPRHGRNVEVATQDERIVGIKVSFHNVRFTKGVVGPMRNLVLELRFELLAVGQLIEFESSCLKFLLRNQPPFQGCELEARPLRQIGNAIVEIMEMVKAFGGADEQPRSSAICQRQADDFVPGVRVDVCVLVDHAKVEP